MDLNHQSKLTLYSLLRLQVFLLELLNLPLQTIDFVVMAPDDLFILLQPHMITLPLLPELISFPLDLLILLSEPLYDPF